MEIEHIVPESLGGRTEEGNLWLACSLCNKYTADRLVAVDPLGGDEVRLFDPRRQVWSDHFEWMQEGTRIAGKTATGRATVAALRLNRPPLVVARALWAAAGWHPPQA